MRIDLCKKCGSESEISQKCSICTEPTKFICKNCDFETNEQIHLQCRLIDMDYKLLDVRVAA